MTLVFGATVLGSRKFVVRIPVDLSRRGKRCP